MTEEIKVLFWTNSNGNQVYGGPFSSKARADKFYANERMYGVFQFEIPVLRAFKMTPIDVDDVKP